MRMSDEGMDARDACLKYFCPETFDGLETRNLQPDLHSPPPTCLSPQIMGGICKLSTGEFSSSVADIVLTPEHPARGARVI